MRKLFVSFTATLRALKDGTVTGDDLANGLFYFGCSREHAISPSMHTTNEVTWYFKNDPERGRAVHEMLVSALLAGEIEGRVIWRGVDARNTYEALNELLVRHGFDAIPCGCGGRTTDTSYCYPGVADRIAEAGVQLQVVK